jgi:hypothetical protein
MSKSQNTSQLFLSKKRKCPMSIFKVTKYESKPKEISFSFKPHLTLESHSQSDLSETFCDSVPQTPSHTSIQQVIIPDFFNDKPIHKVIQQALEQYERVRNSFDEEERGIYLITKETLLFDVTYMNDK